jgi:HK97 gp10 family phage protein
MAAQQRVKLIMRFAQLAEEARRAAQDLVRDTASAIATTAQALAPVDTGALRDSIEVEHEAPMRSVVTAGNGDVDYAAYQEFGTSRMHAQPYLTPAVEQERPRFEAGVKRLIK